MARHKDSEWTLNEPVKTWDEVHAALLMDIRDELKALNSKLACHRIQRMFSTIERLDRRLAQRTKLKAGRK